MPLTVINDCEQFSIIDVVIALCRSSDFEKYAMGYRSHRREILTECCAYCEFGRISVQDVTPLLGSGFLSDWVRTR